MILLYLNQGEFSDYLRTCLEIKADNITETFLKGLFTLLQHDAFDHAFMFFMFYGI